MRMELLNSAEVSELNVGECATLLFFGGAMVAARINAPRRSDGWPLFYHRNSLADAPAGAVGKWLAKQYNGDRAFKLESGEFFEFVTKQIAKLCLESEGEL